MLKKIQTDQLQLGMHIHEVCGSWLDHPFWKSSFKLDNKQQLHKLFKAAVKEVWIDTSKGLDVAPPPPPPALQTTSPHVPPEVPPKPPGGESNQNTAPVELQVELERAGRILGQSKQAMDAMFQDARMGKALDAQHCLPLVADITASVVRNPGAIVSLARLKTSDDYTYMHSVAVCALMVALARQMSLSESDTREAGLAGLVHDLGKARTPLEVLNKPGKLTAQEYALIKAHPVAGHRMLLDGQGVGPIPLDVCLHHHERIDGKGYPFQLPADQISLFARMGAVCDVYDAITSNRPYKAGWDPALSLQKMAQWAREGQFDEAVFQAFVKSIGIYPVGSLVRLQSNRLAVIYSHTPETLLAPMVKVFYQADTRQYREPMLIDLSDPAVQDRIVAREAPDQWGFTQLDQYWYTTAT